MRNSENQLAALCMSSCKANTGTCAHDCIPRRWNVPEVHLLVVLREMADLTASGDRTSIVENVAVHFTHLNINSPVEYRRTTDITACGQQSPLGVPRTDPDKANCNGDIASPFGL